MPSLPVLIGVDWGTSSFRAYLINVDGEVVDAVSAEEGIMTVQDNDFESVFERLLEKWLTTYSGLPVMLSGMISSKNGWLELEYVQLPAGASEISAALTRYKTSKGRVLHFASGLAVNKPEIAPDVMRGEETELLGQLFNHGNDGLFLLPGTHSKWVWIENHQIINFQTFMTGEVYAVLKGYSILGKLMVTNFERSTESDTQRLEAFDRGIQSRLSHSGSILHQLFSVRTLPLFDAMDEADVADYLSGLLIGEEISSVLQTQAEIPEVTVIGRGDLTSRYCRALSLMDVDAVAAEQGMVARGHLELAKKKGLVT